MKTVIVALGILLECIPLQAKGEVAHTGTTRPGVLEVQVCNCYKYRPDKQAGRELRLNYKGNKSLSEAQVEVWSKYGSETTVVQGVQQNAIPVLLLPQIGVEKSDTVVVSLLLGQEKISSEVIIPALRHWTVYIYPHSHVDLGYTNTQENVEFIHKRNLDIAMDLAEATADYPEDARFRWNQEVVWPIERYLKSESPAKKKRLIEAIKKGIISVDAAYVSTNTTACSDEELLRLFSFGKELEKETGIPMKTMVQGDIPGMSWGIVPIANQLGVFYCLSLFNGINRTGTSPEMCFKPFWWVGSDGKSKVLYLQTERYCVGAEAKGLKFLGQIVGQTDRTKLPAFIKTDNPRADFIDAFMAEAIPRLENDKDYPYDILPMSWCLADNNPLDADLPHAVKSWNEEYAYPHLKICTGTEMMQAFEKYGDKIPTYQGDYTEYWTDGLGTSAEKTGESREVKEKLVQAEILWSMLQPDKEEPVRLFEEAWRNVILSTEHTWAYIWPEVEEIQGEILKTKFGYFDAAKSLTDQVMNMAYQRIEDKQSDIISVFNTNSWSQTGLVTLSQETVKSYQSLKDMDGNEVIFQKMSSGKWAFLAEEVPALGCKQFRLSKENTAKSYQLPAQSETVLDNGIVRVTVDPLTGDVIKLQYKGEEFVDSQALVALNSFRYLEGENNGARALKDTDVKITVGERGPLVNSLIVSSKAKGCNGLTREIRLIKGSASVEFNNIVDKQEVLQKEGIHFGFAFNIPQSVVKVNIPWGVMELDKEQLKNGNRNWIALQRWLNVSNENKGVTWCPMNACVFESGDMTANILGAATYSPKWIRRIQPSSVIYSWALNNHWYTNFRLSQSGKIEFKYCVLPHVGAYNAARSNQYAMEQYRPLITVQTHAKYKPQPLLSIKGSQKVFLSNYKTVNKGKSNVISLLSLSESDENVTLHWSRQQPKSVYYIENDQMKKLPNISGFITVPARGGIVLHAEW